MFMENTVSRNKPLVLLADDDPELRQMVRLHLEMTECDVLEASDGAEALELLIEEHPQLVILDVMMPELTGWEILRYLRSKEQYDDIGVLMLTAIGPTLNELSSPMYGADDYIDKPFKLEELLAKIRKVLAKHEQVLEDK
jgi:DNA-binding response OmpR family regulator